MGKEYILDVSSPGLDQPIKLIRQLPKHIGRKIKIQLNDSEIPEFTGTLIGLEDDVLELQFKEKKKEPETKKVKFENINESKIIVSFNK
jgi:ribosome maturation factor RimP